MINFKCTGGPYGDACSSYELLSKNNSLLELVRYMQRDKIGWGEVKIYSKEHYPILRFSYNMKDEEGKNFNKIPSDWMNCPVTEGYAHGGWSCMNYTIAIDLPTLPRQSLKQDLVINRQAGTAICDFPF